MMGEEPLEVRSSQPWEQIQLSVSDIRASQQYTPDKTVVPRRTRHRVDAGEPRGCFNNPSSALSNKFMNNGAGRGGFYNNPLIPPYYYSEHHHHYFQPMKMLSEFIASGKAPPQNQALLREMLCKNSAEQCKVSPKESKLDGMIGIMMDKLQKTEDDKPVSPLPVEQNNNENNQDFINNNNTPQQAKNKRKKYQPQKTDLIEQPIDDEFDDDNIKRITRSAAKRKIDDVEYIKDDDYKLEEELLSDMDEEDQMLLRQVVSRSSVTTNNDDGESITQEYENEEEEQEAMINDDLDHHGARRTLPISRSIMDRVKPKEQIAPLTRQLLTNERVSSPVRNGAMDDPSSLEQWKENLKTTLISHINEFVEAQFTVLLTSGLPNSNARPKDEVQKRPTPPRSSTPQQQPKPPQLIHLNGGTCTNSIVNPEKLEAKKLPVRNEFPQPVMHQLAHHHRFPFMQPKPNQFSSALVGLTHQHMQQQQQVEPVFEETPLSLVVNKHMHETPRKKRHKVTDTRLTPRAVSRLLGQTDSPYDTRVDNSLSPSTTSPNERVQNTTPPRTHTPTARREIIPQPEAAPPPPRIFPGFPAPQFFHNMHHETGGLHPALQAPNEYVERLREMSMEQRHHEMIQQQQQPPREHHHPVNLREYPNVRGLRDRSERSLMLNNELLEMINSRSAGTGSDSGGESNSFEHAPGNSMYCHTTSTLTPMHLRKAKLMFFWTRYPSSAVIKMYFPDIKFNKNNTAQLVKWFSNFREFYYIQMEKYARQALSEGVKSSEDLVVTPDSELYRVLNLHYNRNNHIEVPANFRFVVENTLREFFKSVQAGKDSEQSWKKAIYKIIARLDDPVPEYFKSPNFLEQLE